MILTTVCFPTAGGPSSTTLGTEGQTDGHYYYFSSCVYSTFYSLPISPQWILFFIVILFCTFIITVFSSVTVIMISDTYLTSSYLQFIISQSNSFATLWLCGLTAPSGGGTDDQRSAVFQMDGCSRTLHMIIKRVNSGWAASHRETSTLIFIEGFRRFSQ